MAVSAPPDGPPVRYYLVDRISEWEVDKRIRGIKNVAMTEDFLTVDVRASLPRGARFDGMLRAEGSALVLDCSHIP